MNESAPTIPTPESAPVSRQEVVDAYKKFAEAGAGDPADLDMSDPEVVAAHKLYGEWVTQGDQANAEGEAYYRHNLDKTMVNIDAGFTSKTYLQEALDWLSQDAQNVEKIPDNAERTKTRDMHAAAITKIRSLLAMAE